MKVSLAVICGLILLAGIWLIRKAWPPLPAPPMDDDVVFYDFDGTSSLTITLPEAGDIQGKVIVVPPGYTCSFFSNGTTYEGVCQPTSSKGE